MDFKQLTQANLDRFKKMFPDDNQLQGLTLEQLVEYSKSQDPSGNTAQVASEPVLQERFDLVEALIAVTGCEIAVATVVVDCILVIAGAVGIHGKVSASAMEEIAKVIEPELPEIEKIAQILADSSTSTLDKAKAIFNIGKLIYSGGLLEAVYKAIVKSLSWWDMILYGVIGLAELTAVFLTDGAAVIALIVAEMAQIGFVISDSVKVVQECDL